MGTHGNAISAIWRSQTLKERFSVGTLRSQAGNTAFTMERKFSNELVNLNLVKITAWLEIQGPTAKLKGPTDFLQGPGIFTVPTTLKLHFSPWIWVHMQTFWVSLLRVSCHNGCCVHCCCIAFDCVTVNKLKRLEISCAGSRHNMPPPPASWHLTNLTLKVGDPDAFGWATASAASSSSLASEAHRNASHYS